jgi:hypothetical protein
VPSRCHRQVRIGDLVKEKELLGFCERSLGILHRFVLATIYDGLTEVHVQWDFPSAYRELTDAGGLIGRDAGFQTSAYRYIEACLYSLSLCFYGIFFSFLMV